MNHTLNATVNATAPDVIASTTAFVPVVLSRFWDLVKAPVSVPGMLYIITPMAITLIMMELYFGRYEGEELGWNSAVGNALVLIFVGVDLLKTTYPGVAPITMFSQAAFNLSHFSAETGAAVSTLVTILVFAFGFTLLFFNFFHLIGQRLAFFVSGALPVNLVAYVSIVLVYTHNTGAHPLPMDGATLVAALVLFVIVFCLFGLIHALEPKYKGSWRLRKKLKDLEDVVDRYERE